MPPYDEEARRGRRRVVYAPPARVGHATRSLPTFRSKRLDFQPGLTLKRRHPWHCFDNVCKNCARRIASRMQRSAGRCKRRPGNDSDVWGLHWARQAAGARTRRQTLLAGCLSPETGGTSPIVEQRGRVSVIACARAALAVTLPSRRRRYAALVDQTRKATVERSSVNPSLGRCGCRPGLGRRGRAGKWPRCTIPERSRRSSCDLKGRWRGCRRITPSGHGPWAAPPTPPHQPPVRAYAKCCCPNPSSHRGLFEQGTPLVGGRHRSIAGVALQ